MLADLIKRVFGRKYKKKSGRLEIPDLGIKVDVYESLDGNLQRIVDDGESAVVFKLGKMNVLADHNYQGFDDLKDATPGKTKAEIKNGAKIESFVCVGKEIGHIRCEDGKNRLYGEDWKPVDRSKSLCMYTCVGNKREGYTDVYLTYWEPRWIVEGVESHGKT